MPDTMAPSAIDTVELTRALVRCESVTPREAGALQLLERTLVGIGFACERMDFGGSAIECASAHHPTSHSDSSYLQSQAGYLTGICWHKCGGSWRTRITTEPDKGHR